MNSNNAISVKNFNFSYGVESILNNINVTIEQGKFYSILGPNGSGKTTLIRNISKALNAGKEKIFIGEKDICNYSSKALAKEIATVPQSTSTEFDFSVFDIVLMGRAPYITRFSTESEDDLKIAQRAMEITNTWHLKHKDINALSGGERQRVIVARAITQETDIIILDEPISHLDIHHQIEILKALKELNTEKHITIIAVLHDLNLAAAFSHSMILMHEGKVHTQGSPEQILKSETIKEVYGLDVQIIKNPVTGKPHLIPLM